MNPSQMDETAKLVLRIFGLRSNTSDDDSLHDTPILMLINAEMTIKQLLANWRRKLKNIKGTRGKRGKSAMRNTQTNKEQRR